MIPCVILAAGKSTRMGQSKALLPIGRSDTFLTRIVRTLQAAGADDVVVVLGHDAARVQEALTRRGVSARIVVNADYEAGQLSSILAGLRAVDRPGVRAMLVTLVDVPLISAATIRAVVDRYMATGAPIVRAVNGRRHGHPVVIDRSLFGALRSANPNAGAKPVVRAYRSAAGDVEVDDEGAFSDIDTPEDYARLVGNGTPPPALDIDQAGDGGR